MLDHGMGRQCFGAGITRCIARLPPSASPAVLYPRVVVVVVVVERGRDGGGGGGGAGPVRQSTLPAAETTRRDSRTGAIPSVLGPPWVLPELAECAVYYLTCQRRIDPTHLGKLVSRLPPGLLASCRLRSCRPARQRISNPNLWAYHPALLEPDHMVWLWPSSHRQVYTPPYDRQTSTQRGPAPHHLRSSAGGFASVSPSLLNHPGARPALLVYGSRKTDSPAPWEPPKSPKVSLTGSREPHKPDHGVRPPPPWVYYVSDSP